MCAGDTGIHAAFWTRHHKRPYPDFGVERTCPKLDTMARYAHAAMEGITLPPAPPKPSEGVMRGVRRPISVSASRGGRASVVHVVGGGGSLLVLPMLARAPNSSRVEKSMV